MRALRDAARLVRAYAPDRPDDGSWRSVSVRVPRKDLVIRTRSGYYAPRVPSNLLQKPAR